VKIKKRPLTGSYTLLYGKQGSKYNVRTKREPCKALFNDLESRPYRLP